MTDLDTNTIAVLTVIGVLLVLALVAWATQRRHQSRQLQQRFGPEYARTVDHLGDRDKAEAELLARQRRVERLHIAALPRVTPHASHTSGSCCRRASSTTRTARWPTPIAWCAS